MNGEFRKITDPPAAETYAGSSARSTNPCAARFKAENLKPKNSQPDHVAQVSVDDLGQANRPPVSTGNLELRTMNFNPSCDRPDLAEWSTRGGPLPPKLASHLLQCPGCADRVRRLSRVQASLMLLRTQAVPSELVPRANGRALRMLRRVARASEEAKRLLRTHPNLGRWQRAQIHMTRLSLGVAAAGLVLLTRATIFTGLDRTRELGETLATRHWEQHIDPDGEWFGPRGMV
jgi:hypothetical protein